MNEKRLDIQGIRGVAIILVLLCHFFPNQFLIGYIGVDIFFVLSGFLIALLLHRTSTIGFATIVDFYHRRIKRIIPLYFLAISVTVAAMHIFLPTYYRVVNADYAKAAFFLIANMKNNNMEMSYIYTTQKVENFFMHYWSLSVEMQWYLFAPLLILLQKALTTYNRLFFSAVAAVSFYNFVVSDSRVAFFSTSCRLWQFTCGIIAFLFTHENLQEKQSEAENEQEENIKLDVSNDFLLSSESTEKSEISRRNLSPMLLLMLIGPLVIPYANDHLLRVHPTAFTMLLLIVGHREKISLLCNPLLVHIGDISYVLYLVHWPIYKFTHYWWSETLCAPIGFLLSFFVADLVCRYIEKPYMSWERPRIYFLLVATCLCTAVLVYIPPSSPYPFPNAEFNYTGVNVSDASWNHTLMQLLTYHESVRWPANERNLVIPGCKYNKKFAASATEPFGFCEHEPGSGNLTTLVIGNSFACNQADMVHSAFKRIYSNFYVLCLMICEVLSKTDDALCKTRVNYIEIVEELKPNLVFILDRKVVTKEVNDTKAFDNDYVFMQHLYNLASIEHVADKVFILDALPSCRLSCCTMALDFMMKGNKPLRDIGSWLILNDDKPARMRHKELRKRCKKCELIDYLPALLDDDGVYRGYDPDTNLMYVDEVNHLNIFAKQRLQPLFDSLAERVEAGLISLGLKG
ncbi:hypothetical protein Q1695_004640 [Nippostrongylus brasiliensis]|nr:hypothetical protein Q1695_004640 [Nippostrongylus brasiliensis]